MFWLVVGLGAPAVLAISLTVFPERVITLQGRLYRKYYHAIGLSIDEIDRGFQLPADRLLMGKRSEFLQHAEEDPSQFRGLILIYRSIGILIGILLLCAIGLLWLGFATGTLAPLQTAQITELGVCLNDDVYQPTVVVPRGTEQLYICGTLSGTTKRTAWFHLFRNTTLVHSTSATVAPGAFLISVDLRFPLTAEKHRISAQFGKLPVIESDFWVR